MREKLLSQLVAVEAVTDFSEEVGPLDRSAVRSSIQSVQEEVDRLLETASVGRLMRHGLRVAIVGPPNVGKSSLLNALLGSDRAIVSPVPGTTRDYVEERADFGGFPVVLIDTAGLRRTEDPIEEIGVQRSISQAAHADLVWYVIDSSVGWTQSDEESVYTFSAPVEVVANKSDLGNAGRGIAVSAITRSGLPELVASAQARFETNEELPAVNLRHRELLAESATALESAVSTLASDHPDDLVSVSLQEAVRSLGEITGETATPDVVSRIFREFCIGK
jgi:tRNA modification GTPase